MTAAETIDDQEVTAPSLPPGPPLPMPVQTILWGACNGPLMRWCQRRYGDMFTIRLPKATGSGTSVIVVDPAAVKEVFGLSAGCFAAAELAPVLEPFLGARSVLLLDGDRHRRERRLITRGLHGEAMSTYAEWIEEITEQDVATWPTGRAFPVWPHMQAITLTVIMRAVFGVAPGPELDRIREPVHRMVSDRGSVLILNPAWRKDFGPRSPWGRFVRLRADVYAMVEGEIAQRRQAHDLESRVDMMSTLIQARDEDGNGLDDLELRDELMTMLFAGHETSATALAWAFDLLVHHPQALDHLNATLDDGDETYLDAVVKEVLRLRPVIPDVGRVLIRPVSIGGRVLPAGVSVGPNLALLHRRPDLYPEPLVFRPERFLGQAAESPQWIPFGGGIRRCLGAPFATMEIHTVLRTVLRAMRLTPVSTRAARPRRRAVTLTPHNGAPVIAQRRRLKAADSV